MSGSLKQWLTALALTLTILSASIIFTLNFRPLYYFDIDYFHLEEYTGYSKEMIRKNYDVLIDYNSVFYSEDLNFPDFPMSEQGHIHFIEVKHIFVFIEAVLFPLSLLFSLIGIWRLKKQKPVFLKLTSVLSLILPILAGLLIALNWNRAFVLFHKLFFNNDYWIFDAATDPIIRILPDGYFMHCALMILVLIFWGSLSCFAIYHKQTGKSAVH